MMANFAGAWFACGFVTGEYSTFAAREYASRKQWRFASSPWSGRHEMKWIIGLLAALAGAAVVLLLSRLPAEDAIRFAGYVATAAIAALVSVLLRRRASRAHRRNRRTE